MTTEPTCEGTGVRTYKCSCGATTTETIAALGHTWDNGTVTTEPTCEGTGVRTYKCSCGETGTLPIAALGHDWDNGTVTTQPTCIENGLRTYTCKNDPSHTTTGVEPATGKHTLSEDSVVVEATCTTDGSITGYCVDCGKVMNKETVPATGHKWDEGVVTTPATCEAAGVKTYTCKNDASHTQTETLKALGHAWDEGVVTIQPTCEAAGVKTYTCKNDASHTRTESIKALGHTWGEWVETKPVQDDVDGEKQRTCTVCGKVETAVIPAEVWYHMTVCTKGIRFRDLENPVTDEWYMFTPVDLSVDGEQVLPLVAGNMHIVGELTITVFEGEVTVTYELVNNSAIYKLEEFMTFLPSLAEVTELDFENMTNFAFGEPISIHDELGNDTKVLLLLRNQVVYEEKTRGLSMYEEKEEDYKLFVEELKLLMD